MLISYCEIDSGADDSAILRQFLKLNVMGNPQSKDHLDMVKDLYSKITSETA